MIIIIGWYSNPFFIIYISTESQNLTMCDVAAATSISTRVTSGWSCSNNNSVPTSEVCSWLGVSCDTSSLVTSIDLSTLQGITGTLSNSLHFLQSLVSLRLGSNSFSGSIPTGLGLLSELRYLNVSYNQLTGPLPPELGYAPLKELVINNNYLTGTVPSGLCRDSYLTYLSGDSNGFSCYATCLSSVATLTISSSLLTCTAGKGNIL